MTPEHNIVGTHSYEYPESFGAKLREYITILSYEPYHEKTNVLVSNLVRHKPGCLATEDGWRLETSDLESRGIVLSM